MVNMWSGREKNRKYPPAGCDSRTAGKVTSMTRKIKGIIPQDNHLVIETRDDWFDQ